MHEGAQSFEVRGPSRGKAPPKGGKAPPREDRVQARELMPSGVRHDRALPMRLHLEEIEQLRMTDDDLEEQAFVRDVLDNDELRDEVLPRHAQRLTDDAPLAEEPWGFEHGADDRVHPSRLLGDVEHDRGNGLRPRIED